MSTSKGVGRPTPAPAPARLRPAVPGHARVAEQGWEAFAAGDEATALARFRRAVRLGDPDPDTLSAWCDLLGDATSIAAELGALLDDAWGDLPPALHARVADRRFDALRAAPAPCPTGDLVAAALETLEAAASGGPDRASWAPLADQDGRAALLDILVAADADGLIAALEHLSFAPPTDPLREVARAWAARVGDANPHQPAVVRAAERSLFALGDAATARRLERARKAATPRPEPGVPVPPPPPISLAGLAIVVAGGHDGLRALVAADLDQAGARAVRSVPPAWEGQLGGGVEATVREADLVVLVIRQLDHATGDAVAAAAAACGVPTCRARTASRAAIRAAVESTLGDDRR